MYRVSRKTNQIKTRQLLVSVKIKSYEERKVMLSIYIVVIVKSHSYDVTLLGGLRAWNGYLGLVGGRECMWKEK